MSSSNTSKPSAEVPHNETKNLVTALGTPRMQLWVRILIVVGVLATGIVWVFASPVGNIPDDDFHQTSIWCPHPVKDSGCEYVWDAEENRATQVTVPKIVDRSPCFMFKSEQSAACQNDMHGQMHQSVWFNQGHYPGPYYHVMHIFVTDDPVASINTMKIFNVVLATALIGGIAMTLPAAGRRLTALVLLGTVTPFILQIVASVNPSSWAITGVLGTWLGLHSLMQSDSRRKSWVIAALTVVSALMAAVARADAGAYIVFVSMMVLWIHRSRLRWASSGKIKKHVLIAAFAMIAGVVSFFSSSQVQITPQGDHRITKRVLPWEELFVHNIKDLPNIWAGTFGTWGLGWYDTPMQGSVWFLMIFFFSGFFLMGMMSVTRDKIVAILAFIAALVVLPMYVLQSTGSISGDWVQPRYIAPLMMGALGFALMKADPRDTLRLPRVHQVMGYLAFVFVHSVALFANLRRYLTGVDSFALSLNDNYEWWWQGAIMQPHTLWILGSFTFALAALAIFHRPARLES